MSLEIDFESFCLSFILKILKVGPFIHKLTVFTGARDGSEVTILAALVEDSGSIPITYTVAPNLLEFQFHLMLFLASAGTRLTRGSHAPHPVCVLLEIKPKVLGLLGKHFTT